VANRKHKLGQVPTAKKYGQRTSTEVLYQVVRNESDT